MSRFEQGFADTQRAAESTIKAATAVAGIAKQLQKAARLGDIAAIRRLSERLAAASDAARQGGQQRARILAVHARCGGGIPSRRIRGRAPDRGRLGRHRMGQRHPVTVFSYTCENTIEGRIRAIPARKQHLFDEVADGVSWISPRASTPRSSAAWSGCEGG